jgi:hypothetical protein
MWGGNAIFMQAGVDSRLALYPSCNCQPRFSCNMQGRRRFCKCPFAGQKRRLFLHKKVKMIHLSQICKLVENREFSMTFVAKDGAVTECSKCRLTSFHGKGRTLNIKLLQSGEIRKVRRCTIIKLDGIEVFL